jgi:single-stranded DNA-binding protein
LAGINPARPGPLAKENTVNSVALIGRLTADPDYRAGEKHESATLRLAVPRPGNSDAADFIDIVTFDKLTGTCAEWLTKGREVAVVGKLRLNEWTSREASAAPHRSSRRRPVPRRPVEGWPGAGGREAG